MCGITGIFLKKTPEQGFNADNLIRLMTNSLLHRGPDDGGIFVDKNKKVFLGHRRLSIIDLSYEACQPMISFSKRYVIIFNGEIYNYKTIWEKLGINNVVVKSDSRVLIEAISKWGLKKTLNEIIGMFAFAVWDNEKEILKIVTDHLNKKPLYWVDNDEYFAFGSELKALRKIPDINKTLSISSIDEYLCSGFISAPNTIYEGIYKLGSSQILKLKIRNGPNIYNYEPKSNKNTFSSIIRKNDYFENFESVFSTAVKDRMVSDVPIGCFLSGGIDSNLVTYYAQKFSQKKIDTFTVGFNEKDYDETKKSRKVARYLKTNHHEIFVNETDFLEFIHKSDQIFDEPFSDPSYIPITILSNIAKSYVKVILTGDGGDELFGGYRRHKLAYLYTVLISKFNNNLLGYASRNMWDILIKTLYFLNCDKKILQNEKLVLSIQKLIVGLSSKNISHLYSNSISKVSNPIFFEKLNFRDFECITNKFILDENTNSLNNFLNWDLNYYLTNNINVKIDRASMSKGLEVRSPFMDKRMINLSKIIPISYKTTFFSNKLLPRQLLNKVFPSNIISEKKHPFFIPIGKWLKRDLKNFSYDLISNGKLIELGYFKIKDIDNIFKLHIQGKRNYEEFIWNITMFEKWIKNNH